MHYWYWYGGWWWMTAFGMVCLLFVAAVIGFTVYMVARALRHDEAVAILRRQFAEGKLNEEDYQRKVSLLKKK